VSPPPTSRASSGRAVIMRSGSPVIITKSGRDRLVVISVEAFRDLFGKMAEMASQNSGESGPPRPRNRANSAPVV
jgi:hypothetical protein